MQFDDSDRLDTSSVQDRRGLGGRTGLAIGGGGVGVVGVIVYLLIQVLGGGSGSGGQAPAGSVLDGLGTGRTASGEDLASSCRTGADANAKRECAVVADIQSIQDYWGSVLGSRYVTADTVFFSGSTDTGCGPASSGTGPFYCPADALVYIDLTFYDDLRTRFGAQGGTFVDAYVLAHEYGHHVQDLLGTESKVQSGVTGATSGSVRLELQADCFAGVWGHHAGRRNVLETGDVEEALGAAAAIGDDRLQRQQQGTVVPESFTHGSSEQRVRWFRRGLETGDMRQCDTFQSGRL